MINWHWIINRPKEEIKFDNLDEKSYSDVIYMTNKQEGYSIALENDRVSYVILFGNGDSNIPVYPHKLPYGITWDQTNADIVRRLGEPDKKISPRKLGIEITYTHFGLSIEFVSSD